MTSARADQEVGVARKTERGFSGAMRTGPDLEFTGERIVPGKTTEPLFREHEERYVFAGQYVSGKKVLDVACGTGVGTSYLLTAGAASCHGIDIDAAAIDYARAAFEGCIFVQGDAARICLPDSSIDVVVSFETMEHIADQWNFILECKRVLRPHGLLICSTPNKPMYRWRGANPYHVHELTVREFTGLIAEHFRELALFSQDKRNYPLYVARTLALRTLSKLRLRETMRRVWSRKPASEVLRRGFVSDTVGMNQSIAPYRSNFLVQPMYVIAVARKASI